RAPVRDAHGDRNAVPADRVRRPKIRAALTPFPECGAGRGSANGEWRLEHQEAHLPPFAIRRSPFALLWRHRAPPTRYRMPPLSLPPARQFIVVLIVGFLSLGYALYFRSLVIEQSSVGLACEAGLSTWLCLTRRIVIALFGHSAFGIAAMAAAVLNLIR